MGSGASRQFDYKFLGMGNNPISFVDPTGGYVGGGGDDPPIVVYTHNNITSTVHELDEVVITPQPFSVEVDGEVYTFWKGNTDFQRGGLQQMWAPDNSIANYAYYMNNKEKFGDAEFSHQWVGILCLLRGNMIT